MKIIELCTSKGWGGLELYAWQVSKWLKANQHHCHAVIVPESLIATRLLDSGISVTYIKPIFRLFPCVAAFRLARYIDKTETDILHVHWTRDLILAALAKRLCRRTVKLVFIRHMALTRHKRDVYHRFIYQSIDRFLVITKKLYAEAQQYLPLEQDKLQLLYHGVGDVEPGAPAVCEKLFQEHEIPKLAFKILLPGRIEHYKGQHTLIDAVAQLQTGGFDVEVSLLGHVMDKAYFKNLQEKITSVGLEKKVHYLGFVDKPTLIYGCFNVVVLTTYSETFGLVLVEAMKSGVAVIGTDSGGVPEIIEHEKTGMLFEPANAIALADCLQKLIEDSALCDRLAIAGKEYADKTFSEQEHYSKLIQIFSDVVNEKSDKNT